MADNGLKVTLPGRLLFGVPGENGATFVPHISNDGDLSWSNDKGLENPPTVNIRGPAATDGQEAKLDVITVTEDGFTDISGLRRLKSWGVVENGNTVTLNYTLEGDENHTDVMTFDENGYPVSIVADGFEALGTWTVVEEAASDG